MFIIYVSFYLIAAADLYHVIIAACEAFHFLIATDAGVFIVFSQYWFPILLGNTIGGVFLLTVVNYAQTEQSRYPDIRKLTFRELLFSWRGGTDTPSSEETDDTITDTEY